MSKNVNVALFLKKLGGRLSKENNLSDITWAIVQTVPAIGRDICEFFGVTTLPNEPMEVQREYPIGDGRVDLAFITEKNTFLLENKIWDRNYHIQEYAEAACSIRNVTLGLISNHRLTSLDSELARRYGWKVRYWDEIVGFLSKREFGDSQPLVRGYIDYIKEVCSMVTIHKIRLEDSILHSLFYLNILIKKIIESSSHEHFEYRFYPAQRAFGPSCSGCYYLLTNITSRKVAYPFFGIEYSETPYIYVCLDDWSKEIAQKFQSLINKRDDFCEIRKHNGEIDFLLLSKHYQSFNESNLDEQESILRNFFAHVNKKIEEYL
ncbi:MAG: hypothetical protein ACFFCW_09785 [Candidatus Hodarchaeota archaeon]